MHPRQLCDICRLTENHYEKSSLTDSHMPYDECVTRAGGGYTYRFVGEQRGVVCAGGRPESSWFEVDILYVVCINAEKFCLQKKNEADKVKNNYHVAL